MQSEIRSIEEESRQVKAVGMKKQGEYTRWEKARARKVTWNELWKMDGHKISFLLRSVYDVLPSPTNLRLWGLTEDPNCKLCNKPANLEHVLSSCRTALTDGRYTWRHNHVLKEVAATLDIARRKKTTIQKGPTFIDFVRGGKGASSKKHELGILATANDWEMQADLVQKSTFPREIIITNLRPDIVLWSRSTRQVILVELTIPWETRLEEAHEIKLAKYLQLIEDIQQKKWKAWNFPIEIGCRGFASQTLWRAMRFLGIIGPTRKSLIANAGKRAEEASCWLWRKREEQWTCQSVLG